MNLEKKIIKMETIEKIDQYLTNLKLHLKLEDYGELTYKKFITDDTDKLWTNYEEYIKRHSEDVFYTFYGLFIYIIDKHYYYKLHFESYSELPIYLIQVLQKALDKIKN